MNIWLMQIGEAVPIRDNSVKQRTALIADKLIERGHQITWWTSAFDHFKKEFIFNKDTELVIKKDLKVIAFKAIGYRKNFGLSRFIDHRIIAAKFRAKSKNYVKPDIIIASTPSYDLAYEAILYAKKNKVPILVDIRDQWPDVFLNYPNPFFRKALNLVMFNEYLIVKRVLGMADGLIAMMNDLLDWGLAYACRYKTERDKVFYLGYKRDLRNQRDSDKITGILSKLSGKFIVTFIGTFSYNNNPSILLDCAARLEKEDIYFVLAGDGEFFKEIKKRSSLMPNISLTGWLDQEDITTLLKYSHVGICHTTQKNAFFPNKIFVYLSAGVPIISAIAGELKEFLEKYEIGLYYPSNNIDSLVSAIMKIYNDPQLRAKMSANASKIFNEMLDADKIYNDYADYVELMARTIRKDIYGETPN